MKKCWLSLAIRKMNIKISMRYQLLTRPAISKGTLILHDSTCENVQKRQIYRFRKCLSMELVWSVWYRFLKADENDLKAYYNDDYTAL
jgi:hypothetical protein